MPESQNSSSSSLPSERVETHRREAQALLKQGGEHPQYEYKRAVQLGREYLEDSLDFIKLVQALANSESATERCIVIGADAREQKFYPVSNVEDFDPANLSKILGAYLDPIPRFHSYNKVNTDDGTPFVLFVLEDTQPRPIVVIKRGHIEGGKTKLEEGDIWIKKNTDTIRAKRADVDLMYKVKSEEEAETRARQRVNHILELIPSTRPSSTSTIQLPTYSLIVGPRNELRQFATELFAHENRRQFSILLELCRETLVEGWDNAEIPGLTSELETLFSGLDDFHTNRFLPALDSVIDLGLLAIKYSTDPEWLSAVMELLIEAFGASSRLNRFLMYSGWLKGIFPRQWWRPAFEIYIGIRTLANYAILRSRNQYLATILPQLVTRVSMERTSRDVKMPAIFWPFLALPFQAGEFNEGRAQYFWTERVGATWGTHFGTAKNFVDSSSQLELLLEFNSYLGTNQIQNPQLQGWVRSHNEAGITFEYVPDLYAQDLQATLPMAEILYDVLASGEKFPAYLTIDEQLPVIAFGTLSGTRRLELYGRFLYGLQVWQAEYRLHVFRRWGFMWDWSGRLKKLVQDAAAMEKAKQALGPEK